MTENRCPLIENCQQKSAVCNVQLPDETCYWFRWFRALDNPWHTGTPTDRDGIFLIQTKRNNLFLVRWADGFWEETTGDDCLEDDDVVAWQKIEENEDGRTD